jgi:hypothetical protein
VTLARINNGLGRHIRRVQRMPGPIRRRRAEQRPAALPTKPDPAGRLVGGHPPVSPLGAAPASTAPACLCALPIRHGLTGDNVYFENSVKLADALIAAGRSYGLLLPDPLLRARVDQARAQFPRETLGN